jgi:hypothetical protein
MICRAFDSFAPALLPKWASRPCRSHPRGSILRNAAQEASDTDALQFALSKAPAKNIHDVLHLTDA